MANRTVTVDLDVNDAKAVRAWQRAKASIQSYEDQLEKLDKKNTKADVSATRMLGNLTAGLGRAAIQFAGIGSALAAISSAASMIRAEYDNLIRRQEEAAGLQVTLGGAEAELFKNILGASELGATPEAIAEAGTEMRDRIAAATRRSPVDVTRVLSQAASSRGDVSMFDVERTVTAALLSAPGDVDAARSRSSLTLGMVAGGLQARQSLGLALAAEEAIPVAQSDMAARAMGRTIPAALSQGFNPAEAVAAFSMFANRVNDVEGRQTATFMPKILNFLNEMSDEDGFLNKIKDIQARVASGELELEFKDLPGEAIFKAPVLDLLTGGAGAGRQEQAFQTVFERMPKTIAAAEERMDLLQRMLGTSTAIETLQAKEFGTFLAESKQAGAAGQGILGALMPELEKVLRAEGRLNISQEAFKVQAQLLAATGEAPGDALIKALETQEELYKRDVRVGLPVGTGPYVGPGVTPTTVRAATAESQQFRELIDLLKQYFANPPNVLKMKNNKGVIEHDPRQPREPRAVEGVAQ